jgi:uroporphyrinogen III methyltransferase/synthase
VPFEIVPGITSAIAAPAYAGIPITHRDHNTSFTIATGHEDPPRATRRSTLRSSRTRADARLLDGDGQPRRHRREAARARHAGETPVAIVREGTKPAQETLVATLDTIVAEVERTRFAAPAIVVIGDVVRERERFAGSTRIPLFGKRVLVTRPARSAGDLAEQLWEIGAEPVLAPTIAIGETDIWTFTSASTVNAFVANVPDAAELARERIVACIGPVTADAASAAGLPADVVAEEFTARGLVDALERIAVS